MATVDKHMKYPSNLLAAMNREVKVSRSFNITEDQFLEFLNSPSGWACLTLREKEVLEVRYKTWHSCKEAGAMIHPPVTGSRFAQVENRLLRKLYHRIRLFVNRDKEN